MKVIVSHDIDHLTVSEHLLKDAIVPKYFVRSYIELVIGKISLGELFNRYSDFFKNKWQHLEDLVEFNQSYNVPSTFFIGVNQGLGLSYSISQANYWIKRLKELKCEVHVHGIEFESFEKINQEFQLFKELSNQDFIGTRMHYIRKNEHTLNNMAKVGYVFDTSEMSFKAPYKINGMWEFPFQIMDGYIIEKPKQWQCKNLQQCIEESKKLIDKAYQENLPYLGVDFHDRYFSSSHKTWKNWYIWIIDYLHSQKLEFVNFNQAIEQLDNSVVS
jgi:peptidoglycan/xylan/chitin deacetylase (PgdA/CDA1 family)